MNLVSKRAHYGNSSLVQINNKGDISNKGAASSGNTGLLDAADLIDFKG